jgi:hypothetical protein
VRVEYGRQCHRVGSKVAYYYCSPKYHTEYQHQNMWTRSCVILVFSLLVKMSTIDAFLTPQ